jgi:hypothetical protein
MDKQRIIHGRTITAEELEGVRSLLRDHPDWTRLRLSREVCAAWDWRDAKGRLRDMACRTVLLRLHRSGEINLPAPRHSIDNRRRPLGWTAHDTTPVRLSLRELVPLNISIPRSGSADARLFRFLLEQYHYLGLAHVPGENMAYLIRGANGRELGCLLFAAAAWKAADRDQFIGWTTEQRAANLSLITNNARFLILPWVEVKNMASHILSLAARRVRSDWEAKYGHPVHALETFIDRSRFKGTCYRAANWLRLGKTSGRTRNDDGHRARAPVKDVYFYPLVKHLREELSGDHS